MFGETTIFFVKIWNHPIETSIYKWLFGVPGGDYFIKPMEIRIPKLNNYIGWLMESRMVFFVGSIVVIGALEISHMSFWKKNMWHLLWIKKVLIPLYLQDMSLWYCIHVAAV